MCKGTSKSGQPCGNKQQPFCKIHVDQDKTQELSPVTPIELIVLTPTRPVSPLLLQEKKKSQKSGRIMREEIKDSDDILGSGWSDWQMAIPLAISIESSVPIEKDDFLREKSGLYELGFKLKDQKHIEAIYLGKTSGKTMSLFLRLNNYKKDGSHIREEIEFFLPHGDIFFRCLIMELQKDKRELRSEYEKRIEDAEQNILFQVDYKINKKDNGQRRLTLN